MDAVDKSQWVPGAPADRVAWPAQGVFAGEPLVPPLAH